MLLVNSRVYSSHLHHLEVMLIEKIIFSYLFSLPFPQFVFVYVNPQP